MYFKGLGEPQAASAFSYLERVERSPDFQRATTSIRRQTYEALAEVCVNLQRREDAAAYLAKSTLTAAGSRAKLALMYDRLKDTANRDRVLTEATKDLTRRDDVVPVARCLVSLKRAGEAEKFLRTFLDSTPQQDQYRLAATTELLSLYDQAGRKKEALQLAQSVDPKIYENDARCVGYLASVAAYRKAHDDVAAPEKAEE